jgi:hypothetical protein
VEKSERTKKFPSSSSSSQFFIFLLEKENKLPQCFESRMNIEKWICVWHAYDDDDDDDESFPISHTIRYISVCARMEKVSQFVF